VTMICLVAGIAASGFYFFVSPDTSKTKTDDCVAAATSISLVNTSTGMGMTAAVAECE
jgi:SNF family Na+-dependent transporter